LPPKRVPLVDLHATSLADAENAGDDVRPISVLGTTRRVDRTHLNAKGSDVVGRMVAEGLRQSFPS
jgi:lysophospholipase L1-like esterase